MSLVMQEGDTPCPSVSLRGGGAETPSQHHPWGQLGKVSENDWLNTGLWVKRLPEPRPQI